MSTLAEQRNNSQLSGREKAAMRILADEGWSVGELKMTFQCKTTTVSRHLRDAGPNFTALDAFALYVALQDDNGEDSA